MIEWKIKPPFFEIGPKNYLFGDDVILLAKAANEASLKYHVDVLFTAPFLEIRRVCEAAPNLHVLAPHMDALRPGRGIAQILPEGIRASGACGVMLNHCERHLDYLTLQQTLKRADEVGLASVVCADTIEEVRAVAMLHPNIVVAEEASCIGTGNGTNEAYIRTVMHEVRKIDEKILVLCAAGISNGEDVYRTIINGADATGTSSGVCRAKKPNEMVDEMICAVRRAYDERMSDEKRTDSKKDK